MKRQVINNRRYYNVDGKLYPSITTILGSMIPDPGLKEARDAIGHEKFDKISSDAADRGTVMHLISEFFTLNKCDTSKINHCIDKARKEVEIAHVRDTVFKRGVNLFYNIHFSGLFNTIKENIFTEEYLRCDLWGGFAGTCDSANKDIQDKVFLLDYKSSSGIKDEKKILNYKIQLLAYFIMFRQTYGYYPDYVSIWMSNESNITVQEFKYTFDDLKKYLPAFKAIVQGYHEKIGEKDLRSIGL